MASNRKHTPKSVDGSQPTERSNRDSMRWVAGMLLLCAGIYFAVAVFSSFFSWQADQSGLQLSSEEQLTLGVEPENLCGWTGAWLARLLVDHSFGVFGILVAVMAALVGFQIISRRFRLNHLLLSLVLVTLLGSLTLGFAFADKWSLACSTGWGGAFGIEIAALLELHIGSIGTIILLAGGWILTGVFINRQFINTVNDAGNAMADRGGRIVDIVRNRVMGQSSAEEDTTERKPAMRPTDASTVSSRPHATAADTTTRAGATAQAAGAHSATTAQAAAEKPLAQPPTRLQHGFARAGGQENPFFELASDARPVEMEITRDRGETPVQGQRMDTQAQHATTQAFAGQQAFGAASQQVQSVASGVRQSQAVEQGVSQPPAGPFTEIDLSYPEGRLVMGPGGLVEIERPQNPAPPATSNGPFTEITLPVGSEQRTGSAGTFGAVVSVEDMPSIAEPAPDPFSLVDIPTSEGLVVTVEANEAELADENSISTHSYDPLKDLVNYQKPPVTLLEDYVSDTEVSDEEIFDNKTRIEDTLRNFGIPIQRIKATVGPTVTLYEIVQAQGVKIAKIQSLENDIAQSLKALGIRIIAPIPGKGTIGIEVPNRDKQIVSMYSAIRSMRFQELKADLPVVIGRTIQNENYVFDLARMPHLLVAGATGQGKSVGLNAVITSLLYRKHPAQLKFVMIDPKMVEFSLYAKIERHFLAKMESEDDAIVTDPRKAVYTLNALCTEMDNRLALCKKAGARNIGEYNEKFTARQLNPHNGHRYLPFIVVVVDEFADLIMTAREVEAPVMRLAQKARAVGIHLIIATQRPDVKVITGGIKANFPARIAFRVMQMIDSRTIIDQPGANQLIGRGDMLFSKDGDMTRIQCALVETKEVERIVDYISHQQGYTEAYPLPDYTPDAPDGGMGMGSEEAAPMKYDPLFAEIAREAVSSGNISTSMIQRNYEVGFNRAGRIMMQLERAAIVGRQQGAKPRDILFHDPHSLEAKLQELGVF